MTFVTEQPAHCPFCGEPITLIVDASAGSQSYIEDCQVCCRPIMVMLEAENGEFISLNVDCAS
ncbi:MAG: CPXCG motif-containing cysteine-rich protein [Woeseiaceae bacterium]|nr:CPXCG motif-containing cysteine-rich protein [Woeseiaceae bacterium]